MLISLFINRMTLTRSRSLRAFNLFDIKLATGITKAFFLRHEKNLFYLKFQKKICRVFLCNSAVWGDWPQFKCCPIQHTCCEDVVNFFNSGMFSCEANFKALLIFKEKTQWKWQIAGEALLFQFWRNPFLIEFPNWSSNKSIKMVLARLFFKGIWECFF